MRLRHLAIAPLLLATIGCAQQRPLYHWDGYDERLYQHYRNPQDHAAWVAAMGTVVREAEGRGRRVPPGVYAEYGHALLEQGDAANAVVWFEKERALWPESATLMDKMIANARRGGPRAVPLPSVQSPAAPAEKGSM